MMWLLLLLCGVAVAVGVCVRAVVAVVADCRAAVGDACAGADDRDACACCVWW